MLHIEDSKKSTVENDEYRSLTNRNWCDQNTTVLYDGLQEGKEYKSTASRKFFRLNNNEAIFAENCIKTDWWVAFQPEPYD